MRTYLCPSVIQGERRVGEILEWNAGIGDAFCQEGKLLNEFENRPTLSLQDTDKVCVCMTLMICLHDTYIYEHGIARHYSISKYACVCLPRSMLLLETTRRQLELSIDAIELAGILRSMFARC